MYGLLRKILLFSSWFAKEFMLIIPMRGVLSTLWGKFSLQFLGRLLCTFDPRGSSFYIDDLNAQGNLCWFYPYLPHQRYQVYLSWTQNQRYITRMATILSHESQSHHVIITSTTHNEHNKDDYYPKPKRRLITSYTQHQPKSLSLLP